MLGISVGLEWSDWVSWMTDLDDPWSWGCEAGIFEAEARRSRGFNNFYKIYFLSAFEFLILLTMKLEHCQSICVYMIN